MTKVQTLLGVAQAGSANTLVTVSSSDLELFWAQLVPDSYASRRGLSTFLDAVRIGVGDREDAVLAFRPGGWEVDLGRGGLQAVVASGLIAGLLVAFGATQIPAAVVTAVVPLLFDVHRVTLTPGQSSLFAELVADRAILDGEHTVRALYEQLEAETRSQLSLHDFVDFVETCRRAGLADEHDGDIHLRDPQSARFRISFR